MAAKPSAVPVMPNAGSVQGRLLDIQPAPGGGGSLWQVAVSAVHDVPGYPNFARDRVGQTLSVFVPRGLGHGLQKDDTVEALVSFRGDERGGLFVLRDEPRKLS
jgi:hypothetical protein